MDDLTSPFLLFRSWVLAPALVLLASAGIGAGLARLSGTRLGALTLPAGFVTGALLMASGLQLGLHGTPACILVALVALGGAGVALAAGPPDRRAETLRARLREMAWPAGSALAAYAVSIAPLVGTGRSAVVGYVLNDDPAYHLSLIELLRDLGGAATIDTGASSYAFTGAGIIDGYPVGSHAWVLFGSVFSGTEAFNLWTPVLAVCAAFIALVSWSALRELGAPRGFAGPAAAVVAIGYLPFSYLVQGGLKEVVMGLAVYTAVVLFARTEERTWRGLLPAALAAMSAFAIFGLGAAAWIGPLSLMAAVMLVARGRAAGPLLQGLIAATVAVVLALPSLLAAINFTRVNEVQLNSAGQVGNLLDAAGIPWRQALNVWLGGDYRIPQPDSRTLTTIGIVIAGGFAIAGIAYALRRRARAVPLAVATALLGVAVVVPRYAIYFDAKAYEIAATAAGLATAAGVLWLIVRRRRLGIAAAAVLAALVVASDAFVYLHAYATPKDRIQEMSSIAGRFAGKGPLLVNEREDYAKYVLRDVTPWESWGAWQPKRGLRDAGLVLDPAHTPDFADYSPAFIQRFPLLLDRKHPGGSRPPANYRAVHETAHYRVWQRCGPGSGTPLPAVPAVIVPNKRWAIGGGDFGSTSPGLIVRRDAVAFIQPHLAPGSYSVWLQGGLGPGYRLKLGRTTVGDVFGDQNLPSGWQRIGGVRVGARPVPFVLSSLRPQWWRTGALQGDTLGAMAFVPDHPPELGCRP